MKKSALAATVILSISTPLVFAQGVCKNISQKIENKQAFLNPPANYKVIGEGRLYFYTAPNESCRSKDVFVISGDELTAYTEFNGWYSVMYVNPKSGKDYDGWVRSERLKMIGTIRPKF